MDYYYYTHNGWMARMYAHNSYWIRLFADVSISLHSSLKSSDVSISLLKLRLLQLKLS